MREIRFRGIPLKETNGENVRDYVYGDLLHIQTRQGPRVVIFTDSQDIEADIWDDCTIVDPNTVGEFTGLYDKHKEPIYEGDILTSDEGRVYEVCWLKSAWKIKSDTFTKGEKRMEKMEPGKSIWYFEATKFSNLSKLEIIGSIHTDPELLKK